MLLCRVGFSKCAHIIGVVVSETTIETTMAVESVTANSRNRRPDDAAHQQNRNEHGDQRDADGENREADLLRALKRGRDRASCPSSRWREMFSITTMASSTTNPVEMVSAISERLSML